MNKQAQVVLRHGLVKIAAHRLRQDAVRNFSQYLDKLAYDLPVEMQTGFRAMQIALVHGKTLGQATAIGFPKMAADRREKFARGLVKQACGASCKKTTGRSFHGKPAEGHAWMQGN